MFCVPEAIFTLVPSPLVIKSPTVVYLDPPSFEKKELGMSKRF
jgi:hypothetical protein